MRSTDVPLFCMEQSTLESKSSEPVRKPGAIVIKSFTEVEHLWILNILYTCMHSTEINKPNQLPIAFTYTSHMTTDDENESFLKLVSHMRNL